MKITRDFIFQNRTRNGGWTYAQLKALGIPVKGCSGWIWKACEMEFTQEQIDAFVAGKEIYVGSTVSKLKNRIRKLMKQEERLRDERKQLEAVLEEEERRERYNIL